MTIPGSKCNQGLLFTNVGFEINCALGACDFLLVGGKKGNRTEPNRTNGLYRTEPTKIPDCCGTGFYLRHRTEPTNAIFTAYFIIISFHFI